MGASTTPNSQLQRHWIAVALLILAVCAGVVIVNAVREALMPTPTFNTQNLRFGQSYLLNEPVQGDLTIVGSQLELGELAVVEGTISLIGSEVTIAGVIHGDIAIISTNVEIQPETVINGSLNIVSTESTISGVINGDVLLSAENLIIAPEAQLNNGIEACAQVVQDMRPVPLEIDPCGFTNAIAPFEFLTRIRGDFTNLFSASALTTPEQSMPTIIGFGLVVLGLTALNMLGVSAFYAPIVAIQREIQNRPRAYFTYGLAILGVMISGVIGVIILLAHVPILGFLALLVFGLFALMGLFATVTGLSAFSIWVGARIVNLFSKQPPITFISALLGSIIFGIILLGVALLPYGQVLWVIALVLLSATGVGATVWTRFGLRAQETQG